MLSLEYLFSTGLIHLFCYITNCLMPGLLGSREFCFRRISMFPQTKDQLILNNYSIGYEMVNSQ